MGFIKTIGQKKFTLISIFLFLFVILNLLDPLQAASPSVTITVVKSETD